MIQSKGSNLKSQISIECPPENIEDKADADEHHIFKNRISGDDWLIATPAPPG
jgi:hypothetical protein